MTPRTVIVLAAATAVAVAAAAASVNLDRGYVERGGGGPVFPGLMDKIDTVAKIAVDHKDGETVLVRGSGGVWTVPASDDYPASLAQAQKIILQVAGLKYLEAKTANKDRYARLHLEDMKLKDTQARRVRLFDGEGNGLAELIVGKKRYNLPGTQAEGAYIRKPGDPQTWLASGEIDVETQLKPWLRNKLLNIREEDVKTIHIRHPGGEVINISKDDRKDKQFKLRDIPEGKKLRYDSDPTNIANVVEDLELDDARKADKIDFPADQTLAATYTSWSGLTAELRLVQKGEDNWLTVSVSADPNAPAPKEKGAKTAAEIAKQVNEQADGWVFKIPDFKASRLRRDLAEMLIDDKPGS